jgi:nitronate monooxygenase
VLAGLPLPIVLAPMAGGPSTVALAAAVGHAGGLGTLAAGYLSPDELARRIAELRAEAVGAIGVNLFLVGGAPADPAAVAAYAARLAPLAQRAGVALGEARTDDDALAAKVDVVLAARPEVVSFTFGCPDGALVVRLQEAGIEVWVTVTTAAEGEQAAAAGADVVVAQGAEAGGHRGGFTDGDDQPVPVVELVAALSGLGAALPIVAAGGIMDGADLRAVLDAGAVAGQLGTAFLLTPEAGTNPVQRAQVARAGETVLTRAFTGRRARGIANAWTAALDGVAPKAYPEVHHLTAPLRAHGRAAGDPDLVNLWAGTGHARAVAEPAGAVVARVAAELAATGWTRGGWLQR